MAETLYFDNEPVNILDWTKNELIKQYYAEKFLAAEKMVNEGIWTQAEASNWLATGYTFIKSYGVREVE